jgi:hypothetical protein
MPMPVPAGRPRFSFKASHRRMTLKCSHRPGLEERETPPAMERERYIAPPKRRR